MSAIPKYENGLVNTVARPVRSTQSRIERKHARGYRYIKRNRVVGTRSVPMWLDLLAGLILLTGLSIALTEAVCEWLWMAAIDSLPLP